MYSLEAELAALRAAGAAPAAPPRAPFSVAAELRAGLYAGVALVSAGVGLLLKSHLERIGPLTLVLLLAVAAAGCYLPALRASRAARARAAAADYLLLLGALLVSADVGYAEVQFHLLGERWSLYLLALSAWHALSAYRLGSRLVLAVSLASLAAWFGLQGGPGGWLSPAWDTPQLGARALGCAGVILIWRTLDARLSAAAFRPVFEQFAANLAFCGALTWCLDTRLWPAGLAALLALAALSLRRALRTRAELFAVYAVGYGALGLIFLIVRLTRFEVLGLALVLIVVLLAAALLRFLHPRVTEAAS